MHRNAANRAGGDQTSTLFILSGKRFDTRGPSWSTGRDAQQWLDVAINFDGRVVDILNQSYDLTIRVGRLCDSSLVARRLTASQRSHLHRLRECVRNARGKISSPVMRERIPLCTEM